MQCVHGEQRLLRRRLYRRPVELPTDDGLSGRGPEDAVHVGRLHPDHLPDWRADTDDRRADGGTGDNRYADAGSAVNFQPDPQSNCHPHCRVDRRQPVPGAPAYGLGHDDVRGQWCSNRCLRLEPHVERGAKQPNSGAEREPRDVRPHPECQPGLAHDLGCERRQALPGRRGGHDRLGRVWIERGRRNARG